MITLDYVIVILTIASGIIVFIMGRILSRSIEERAEKTKMLKFELEALEVQLNKANEIIEQRNREIESLRSELEEKEREIYELKERLKFAEKVSERDIEFLRSQIGNLNARMAVVANAVEKLHYMLEKKIAKRRAKK